MNPSTYFKVDFELFGESALTQTLSTKTEVDVLTFAKDRLQAKSELCVACLAHGLDFGNLIISVNSHGICDVRAHEHRGFFAAGVSAEDALSALKHWLPKQERLPTLHWQEE